LRDYTRLDAFVSSLGGDVYPEPPMEPHITISQRAIDDLHREGKLRTGMRILDVGCGQGIALEQFRALGLEAVGITLGSDADVCRAKGLTVEEMDQNFMTFGDDAFDFLWCRHVLEHSIAPLFTLSEYKRVLKPGGMVYVEVPAPDTPAAHQTNPNHYSVLPASMWHQLFRRAGFTIEKAYDIAFDVPVGRDTYWGYQLRSPGLAG
jgi:SAM-dependent methyltransferase